MVAIMPEKVEEASLQELTRSLTTILATINQVRAETEAKEDDEVYERLVRHLSQYAPDGAESRGRFASCRKPSGLSLPLNG